MVRLHRWLWVPLLLAGCQAQSPYTPFGPPTVPAPASNQLPYYPPAGATGAVPQSAAASSRPSISVGEASLPAARPATSVDSADRETIRIVENQAPPRTASARKSGAPQSNAPQSAPASQPAGSTTPISTGNKTSGRAQVDPAVTPAAYQQRVNGGFVEQPAATGSWRIRN